MWDMWLCHHCYPSLVTCVTLVSSRVLTHTIGLCSPDPLEFPPEGVLQDGPYGDGTTSHTTHDDRKT